MGKRFQRLLHGVLQRKGEMLLPHGSAFAEYQRNSAKPNFNAAPLRRSKSDLRKHRSMQLS
jgi:hypothetical protein